MLRNCVVLREPPPSNRHDHRDNVASMAWNRHAIDADRYDTSRRWHLAPNLISRARPPATHSTTLGRAARPATDRTDRTGPLRSRRGLSTWRKLLCQVPDRSKKVVAKDQLLHDRAQAEQVARAP